MGRSLRESVKALDYKEAHMIALLGDDANDHKDRSMMMAILSAKIVYDFGSVFAASRWEIFRPERDFMILRKSGEIETFAKEEPNAVFEFLIHFFRKQR